MNNGPSILAKLLWLSGCATEEQSYPLTFALIQSLEEEGYSIIKTGKVAPSIMDEIQKIVDELIVRIGDLESEVESQELRIWDLERDSGYISDRIDDLENQINE